MQLRDLTSSEHTLRMADGRLVKKAEKTAMVLIEVFGNKIFQEFIEINGMEGQDALLGKPWFKAADAGIFPGNDVIVFRQENKVFQINDELEG